MCRGKGRCAQLAFCEPLVNTVPKNFSTKAARLNSRMPRTRAAITVSKILVATKFMLRRKRRRSKSAPCKTISLSVSAVGQRHQIEAGQRIDQVIVAAKTQLHEAKLFEITVQTIGLRIDRDAVDPFQLWKELGELGICRDHFNPLKSSSALVFVACRFSISLSIASIGGSAAIALRRTCTRSHSSG